MSKITHLRNNLAGTPSGIAALLIWSCYAPVMVYAKGLDPFLCAGVLDGVAFLVFLALHIAIGKNPFAGLKSSPWWLLFSSIAGIGGHEVALAAAFQSAPPLEVTLLNYLWPIFLIVLSAANGKQLNAYSRGAACLGFGGVIVMLSGRGLALSGFTLGFGHLWALIGALTWSVFSVTCSRQLHGAVFSFAFLASASLDLAIWFLFGGAAATQGDSVAIVGIASVFFALAYSFWGAGMERGNTTLLGVASFLTPVLASVHLAFLGQAQFNAQLLIALLCIVSAIGIVKFAGDRD
jgi:drug/metabolite transporter (DMT)-like permease